MSTFKVPEGHKLGIHLTKPFPFATTERVAGGVWLAITGYESDVSDEEIPEVLAGLCPPPYPVQLPSRGTLTLQDVVENLTAATCQIASGTVLVFQRGSLAGWTSSTARLEQLVGRLQTVARQTTLVVYVAKDDELTARVAPLLRGAGIDVRTPGERGETLIEVERPDGRIVSVFVGTPFGDPHVAMMSPSELHDAIARTARPEPNHLVPTYSPLMNRMLNAVRENNTPSTLGALLDHLVVRRYGVALMSRRLPNGEFGIGPMSFPGGKMFAVYSNQTSFWRAVQETTAEADRPNVAMATMSISTLLPWAASHKRPIALCIYATAPGGREMPHYIPLYGPEIEGLIARLPPVTSPG